jgi:hypothetical protein
MPFSPTTIVIGCVKSSAKSSRKRGRLYQYISGKSFSAAVQLFGQRVGFLFIFWIFLAASVRAVAQL